MPSYLDCSSVPGGPLRPIGSICFVLSRLYSYKGSAGGSSDHSCLLSEKVITNLFLQFGLALSHSTDESTA